MWVFNLFLFYGDKLKHLRTFTTSVEPINVPMMSPGKLDLELFLNQRSGGHLSSVRVASIKITA